MKRKLLLFLAVLIVLLAVKYALGQSDVYSINWDQEGCIDCSNSLDGSQDLAAFLLCAPLLGVGFALVRWAGRHFSRPLLEPLRLN
jgi:hypothetical protein